MTACACGENWRFEIADLRSGRVRAILHPVAADWQTNLNRIGQGTITLATRDVVVRDIWPHLSSLYVTRTGGPGASPSAPVVEFAGMLESFTAMDDGTTVVGVITIDGYLRHRNIRDTLEFDQVSQTQVGKALVDYAATDGIPLTAVAAPSVRLRDRTYHEWDRKQIAEALEQLSDVIDGVDWELSHAKTGGAWTTTMTFRDRVGAVRDLILQSDREAAGYGLDVDARDHATHVDALGEGEEEDMLIRSAVDPTGVYPRFDAAPAWKDVSQPPTLQSHADGYLADYRDPVAVPSVTLRGLAVDSQETRLGDTVTVRVNYGAVTYKGPARIIGIAWALSPDEPETRTLSMVPLTRSSESVLNQVPDGDSCEDC
jgi:hypothetical protein